MPSQPSDYRDQMLAGDQAFRTDNYHRAYGHFEIANYLGDHDPESYLCMLHAQFALSSYSYARASYFLQKALEHMPELPTVHLRPRGFYGSLGKYAEHLVSLQEHIARNPQDDEALLLLAYFRWFGRTQDTEATREALSRSLAASLGSNDTRMVEAVQTFWDGMVATGKVSGKLKPAAAAKAAPGSAGAAGTPPAKDEPRR